MKILGNAWKAITAAVVPGAVVLAGALTEGSPGGSSVTTAEWVLIAIAVLTSGGATYVVPPGKGITTPPAQ